MVLDPSGITKLINGISNYGRHFLKIFLPEQEVYWQGRFQNTKSINQLDFFY